MIKESGKLFIIATPIGNVGDITLRAIETLKNEVEIVYCEDTRQTKRLLNNLNLTKRCYSLHAHSSEEKLQYAIKELEAGNNLAYVTDAGTPGVSDPGSKLVDAVQKAGFQVSPIPGVSALASIISVCGFNGKNIAFGGFLSKKPGRRINELKRYLDFEGTLVFYESPHRIKKFLLAVNEVFSEAPIVIGRELTKIHEEILYYQTTTEMLADFENLTEKGEFVIAINNSH